MGDFATSVFRTLAAVLPKNSRSVYEFCRSYADRYDGDNDSNMLTNGEFRFLKDNVGEFHVVFDVGANVGDWTRMLLGLRPDAVVHCFEPSPQTFGELQKCAFGENVQRNNFGLGSRRQEIDLFVYDRHPAMNSAFRREGLETLGFGPPDRCEAASVTTFDEYCLARGIAAIDFVKIDVEGYELEVLRGMTTALDEGRVKALQFEYGGTFIDSRSLLKDIFTFFQDRPYDLFKVYPDRLAPFPHYAQSVENFQYQNWIAIRKGANVR